MLDLQQLNYFVAVAQTESIARAAELLHISQSPLSRQIIALESRLGLSLFTRLGKRLKLTPTGREFLAHSEALLAQSRNLERLAQQTASGTHGSLRIGYVESAVHCGVVQRALRNLKAEHPGIRVQLLALRTDAQFVALSKGDIDLGFAHRAAPSGQALQSKRVAVEAFVLALPSGHALARQREVLAQHLGTEDFVLLSRQTSPEGHAALVQACQLAGFEPRVQHEVASPHTALGLVAEGLGLAIVQQSFAKTERTGVVFKPMPKGFSLKLEVHLALSQSPSNLANALFKLAT